MDELVPIVTGALCTKHPDTGMCMLLRDTDKQETRLCTIVCPKCYEEKQNGER